MAIGPNGITFTDRDYLELAKILNELNDPEILACRQKMCFDFAVKRYSMSSVVHEFIENVDGNLDEKRILVVCYDWPNNYGGYNKSILSCIEQYEKYFDLDILVFSSESEIKSKTRMLITFILI